MTEYLRPLAPWLALAFIWLVGMFPAAIAAWSAADDSDEQRLMAWLNTVLWPLALLRLTWIGLCHCGAALVGLAKLYWRVVGNGGKDG